MSNVIQLHSYLIRFQSMRKSKIICFYLFIYSLIESASMNNCTFIDNFFNEIRQQAHKDFGMKD